MKVDVTCLCMTHGRTWWLREAVECWRMQKIPSGMRVELLTLNDCPEQVLSCDLSGVRIINLHKEISDQSDKQNHGVLLALGEWVAFWDDDDLCLPLRLSQGWKQIQDHPDDSAFCYKQGWYMENGVILDLARAPYYGAAFYKASDYLKCGGARRDQPPDQSAWRAIRALGTVSEIEQAADDVQFIYRWGGGIHDSAIQGFRITNTRRHEIFRSRVMSDRRFVSGRFKIVPGWDRDYEMMTRNALATGRYK